MNDISNVKVHFSTRNGNILQNTYLIFTETPPPCDKTRKHGSCAANTHRELNICDVPNVDQLLSVSVHNQVNKTEPCVYYDGPIDASWSGGPVYGIYNGTSIFAAGGCRYVAEFCSTGNISDFKHFSINACI